ncbi:tetratricopeptide repeat protein [Flavobacterium sp. K5-23]|uniref:tetratricopeptide repeat protein n=1 Tax=Flavobacterium sp. K5-23 TaxID=2746225 RepID=UPI00200DF7E4|nr:tetratricopeptide repeat protein [Flavobacterium sp. K5-23]UQD55472.1 tetratricopeptide repeat protein [Flavobacterium sp. K5-23]
MKNILYILLLTSQIFFAQNGFEIGNDLYKKGNYDQAVKAYEGVLEINKQHSAELYFNLANSYYKLNKVAPAIYNYEKALVLSPENKDVLNNLRFAQKRTIDEIKVVPKVGFAKLLRDFTGIYHYNTWGWIAISFSFLFLFSFLGYYFSQMTLVKRLFFFGMFALLVLLAISMMAALFEKSYYENEKPAIVFAEMTKVKSEPKKLSSDIIMLHEGTKVFVEDSVGNWKKIQLTDGTEGWIESAAIREVK